jgi:hypothetical protein
MTILKTLTLAAATALSLSTLADAATVHPGHYGGPIQHSYGARDPNNNAGPSVGYYGSAYSSDPATAALERLADHYHNTY